MYFMYFIFYFFYNYNKMENDLDYELDDVLDNNDFDNNNFNNNDNDPNDSNNININIEIIDRLKYIIYMLNRYNCDIYKKYINLVNEIINEFTFLKVFSLFNSFFSDIYIINYDYLHNVIKFYYKEIKEMILSINNDNNFDKK